MNHSRRRDRTRPNGRPAGARRLLPGVPLPSPLKYSQDTAALFAHMADPYLPPTTRLQVSVLLQLATPAEIAKTLGNTAEHAISAFNLQPYLDVITNGQHAPS